MKRKRGGGGEGEDVGVGEGEQVEGGGGRRWDRKGFILKKVEERGRSVGGGGGKGMTRCGKKDRRKGEVISDKGNDKWKDKRRERTG